MRFLKKFWLAILGAVAFFLAIWKAQAATQATRKAQDARQAEKEADVAGHIGNAQRYRERAEAEEEKAEAIKKQIKTNLDRVGEKDETIADVVGRWKPSKRMRNRNT